MTALEQSLTRKIIGLKAQIRRLKAEHHKPKLFHNKNFFSDPWSEPQIPHPMRRPTGAVRPQVGQTPRTAAATVQSQSFQEWLYTDAQRQQAENSVVLEASRPVRHGMPFPIYRTEVDANGTLQLVVDNTP